LYTTLPRLRYAKYFARIEQSEPPDTDGWIPVSIRFDLEAEACVYVLGFGTQMEVIKAPQLHDRILKLALAAIAFHTQRY
jgi:predicted DNA-binding transcriptional regulator YafY